MLSDFLISVMKEKQVTVSVTKKLHKKKKNNYKRLPREYMWRRKIMCMTNNTFFILSRVLQLFGIMRHWWILLLKPERVGLCVSHREEEGKPVCLLSKNYYNFCNLNQIDPKCIHKYTTFS